MKVALYTGNRVKTFDYKPEQFKWNEYCRARYD